MKLKFKANKTTRINHMFVGMTTFEENWGYNYDLKKWENKSSLEFGKYHRYSHQGCRTMKAFRRKLKKAPKGVEFVLCSRYKGNDIIGVGSLDK